MEVILLKGLKGRGKAGEIISVKSGFFRNYLGPKGFCIVANNANKAEYETMKAKLEADSIAFKASAETVLKTINNKEIIVQRSAGEAGHLYGSVKILDISRALNELSITHDKANIIIPNPIKMLGIHSISLVLHSEVIATLLINVARSKEDSKTQMEAYKKVLEAPKKAVEKFESKAAALEAEIKNQEETLMELELETEEKEEKEGVTVHIN